MLELPSNKLVFVCGPVRSGKTHLLKTWLETQNRYVVFDGTGEFTDAPGVEQFWARPKALWERIKANPYYYRCAYQPGPHMEEDFSYVLTSLWWVDQPKLLMCDEFHEICPLETRNEDVQMMLRYARHDKLCFVGASQRIADVHKLFTSGCFMTVLFHTQEARDLDAIDDRWRCADMVESLRPLIHDELKGVTSQVPQCVICVKGEKPRVYDFNTGSSVEGSLDNRVGGSRRPNDEQAREATDRESPNDLISATPGAINAIRHEQED